MESQWLCHPLLFGLNALTFLPTMVDFRDEVVELSHSLIFTLLRVTHSIEKLLPLELQSTELGLHLNVTLVQVRAHLLFLKCQ